MYPVHVLSWAWQTFAQCWLVLFLYFFFFLYFLSPTLNLTSVASVSVAYIAHFCASLFTLSLCHYLGARLHLVFVPIGVKCIVTRSPPAAMKAHVDVFIISALYLMLGLLMTFN